MFEASTATAPELAYRTLMDTPGQLIASMKYTFSLLSTAMPLGEDVARRVERVPLPMLNVRMAPCCLTAKKTDGSPPTDPTAIWDGRGLNEPERSIVITPLCTFKAAKKLAEASANMKF